MHTVTPIRAPRPFSATALPPLLTHELLQRLDQPGPRYTSYPTADRFVDAWGAEQHHAALAQRREAVVAPPLSVYVHVPFCESVCYYCACNKIITRHHERGTEYLDWLERELALTVDVLGRGQALSQLHLGGGTPTFLSDAELARLMAALRRDFNLLPGAECAIEVDPRTVTPQRLQHLRELGFNRLSLGVQDFDPAVQAAVHRIQLQADVQALVGAARELGFESINVDLIYGLPRQTPASFARTVAEVAKMRPDRIALYGYAHLPARFKPQRRIDAAELPSGEQRLRMLGGAIEGFIGSGYAYIGMDHFALPDDALAVAQRQGRLHRNFQGYSTQPEGDLLGLGVSAIGRIGASHSQNAKTLPEYQDALAQGRLPVVRGLALSRDDLLRRSVIMGLMCQGRVDFEAVEQAHLVRFDTCFANELAALQPMAEAGLVELSAQAIQLTPLGWFFVRAVAMVFDRYLQADTARQRFSRII